MFFKLLYFIYVTLFRLTLTINAQDKSSAYVGTFLDSFQTYAHQVKGDVYAVNDHTLYISHFHYDGLGQDAYFWAGNTNMPSNIGFIIPNEHRRTNKLEKYDDVDFMIMLPENKKISDINWLAVWDIRAKKNFGNIFIPKGFTPPHFYNISALSQLAHNVKSNPIIIINSRMIKIPKFSYDGKGKETYFMVGFGPQPHGSGQKIPDERGNLESLGVYENEDIVLQVPNELSLLTINWLAVWSVEEKANYGSTIIPPNILPPPSLLKDIKHVSKLPNCRQLHRKIQLYWEIFGPQITFEIVAQIEPNDYIGFGISGSPNSTQMINSDVVVLYLDGHFGFVTDYNITDRFPCTNVLGLYKGVCPDVKVGGAEDYQILNFAREDGLTKISFRRNLLNTGDEGDKLYNKNDYTSLIWSVGKYNLHKEPRMHYLYPKGNIQINFGSKQYSNDCFPFSFSSEHPSSLSLTEKKKFWGSLRILNQTSTTFYARIGVSGGLKDYSSSTENSGTPGYVWYINGLMAPILYVKRGVTYTFQVEGGNNPQNALFYHPLYITDDPEGGFIKRFEEKRKENVRIYAGIDFDKKGRPSPISSGRLCHWFYPKNRDARKLYKYFTFMQFRDSLKYECEKGSPAFLHWTPNSSVPDLVYYQSYTQRNMGGKIFVVDDFSHISNFASNSFNSILNFTFTLTFTFLMFLFKINKCYIN